MSFVFSFITCKPFLYLIGSLVISSVFGLILSIIYGGVKA